KRGLRETAGKRFSCYWVEMRAAILVGVDPKSLPGDLVDHVERSDDGPGEEGRLRRLGRQRSEVRRNGKRAQVDDASLDSHALGQDRVRDPALHLLHLEVSAGLWLGAKEAVDPRRVHREVGLEVGLAEVA